MTKEKILDSIYFDYRFPEWNENMCQKYGQLSYGALVRALFEDVDWFFDQQEGSYEGDWYMIGRKGDNFYFFMMGYGSCSGCDWLESCNERESLEKLLDSIINIPIFDKSTILEHVKKFDWQSVYGEERETFEKKVVEAVEEQLKKVN